ncbi:MAG: CocE/NonD family hydrolase [SAR202 cluster bacterium]|nr:CocE/NonD family hydrolase [SAR202 cluster bacterium]
MPKTYSVRFDSKLTVPMRDGTRLYADVFRPVGTGKHPVLLQRTPYDRTDASMRMFFLDSIRAARQGYAVVIQDVRGRYASEGEFHTFINEMNDGYDTIEWAAKQPWSDGQVGMFGGSYVGATQWLAASSAPPSLKGIAPVVTASDYHEGWTYQGGALNHAFNVNWTFSLTTGNWNNLRRRYGVGKRQFNKLIQATDEMGPALRHLPLNTLPDFHSDVAKYYYAWLEHPEFDAYWKKTAIEEHHSKINVPALNVGGWFDIFLGGTLRNYQLMKKNGATPAARKGQRLIVGPWVHEGSSNMAFPGVPVGEHYFGMNSYAAVTDLSGQILRFYDHVLKGKDNGVADEKPVQIFVMGENAWRSESDWPLPQAKNTRYYLHSGGRANTLHGDGTLSRDEPGAEPPDTFVYNPLNPVPTRGGQLCCFYAAAHPGSFDQTEIESRADVLCYTTPPLERDTEVTGPITVTLYAASTAKDTDFTAKLVDVSGDGCCARNLTDGIIRARYRKPRSKPQLLTPGQAYEYRIDLWATSNLFKKGHRIRVEISSSNFPRFDRNLNTGEHNNTSADFMSAAQTILHDKDHRSHIVLPIVPR